LPPGLPARSPAVRSPHDPALRSERGRHPAPGSDREPQGRRLRRAPPRQAPADRGVPALGAARRAAAVGLRGPRQAGGRRGGLCRTAARARDPAGGGDARPMTRLLVALLDAYKRWVSPLLPPACRFVPTCSEYARLAVLEHGPLKGVGLAL